jgi:hypothetical protein
MTAPDIITDAILASILRKNKRARQRMARRYARKVKETLNDQNLRFTSRELYLHSLEKSDRLPMSIKWAQDNGVERGLPPYQGQQVKSL